MTTREEFEAWIASDSRVKKYDNAFEIEANGEYYWPQIEWSWQAWQASRDAALDDKIAWDPEDCHVFGCEACEFEESDWHDGTWNCPECGDAQ